MAKSLKMFFESLKSAKYRPGFWGIAERKNKERKKGEKARQMLQSKYIEGTTWRLKINDGRTKDRKKGDRPNDRPTDRLTDRPTDRQTDRQTDRHRHTDRQERKKERKIERKKETKKRFTEHVVTYPCWGRTKSESLYSRSTKKPNLLYDYLENYSLHRANILVNCKYKKLLTNGFVCSACDNYDLSIIGVRHSLSHECIIISLQIQTKRKHRTSFVIFYALYSFISYVLMSSFIFDWYGFFTYNLVTIYISCGGDSICYV